MAFLHTLQVSCACTGSHTLEELGRGVGRNPIVPMGPLLAAAAAVAARTRARRGAVSPASSSVTPLTWTIRTPPIIRAASTAAHRARARSHILAAVSCASAAAVQQHNAHALRGPKHEGRYRNGRRRGRKGGMSHGMSARALTREPLGSVCGIRSVRR